VRFFFGAASAGQARRVSVDPRPKIAVDPSGV
jgi:hypothetical protein